MFFEFKEGKIGWSIVRNEGIYVRREYIGIGYVKYKVDIFYRRFFLCIFFWFYIGIRFVVYIVS